MPRNHFFLAKMARFRLRKFQDSNIPRTQASCMPRTPSCMPGTASCMPGTASCMPKHQLLGFQYALVAVGSCLRRFYFLKTGVPFHTKALVLDLHLGCLGLEDHFPRNCSKNIDFSTVWEPPGILNRIHRIQPIHRKWCTAGTSDPRFSAPEARMTAVKQTPSNYCVEI